MSVAYTWGTTGAERALAYPCDRYVEAPRDELFRGVSVNARAAVVFRWLCQLRAAPYSYDWIDNFGRRSPPQLLSGLDALAPGQRVMTIFELVEFEQDRSITVRIIERGRARRLFDSAAVTYMTPNGRMARPACSRRSACAARAASSPARCASPSPGAIS
jgi:hypothetical protein